MRLSQVVIELVCSESWQSNVLDTNSPELQEVQERHVVLLHVASLLLIL
jgi:hypothetical protein